MTERWCRGCRGFYDTTLAACPDCGTRRHAFNAGLAASKWNTALRDKAAATAREA